MKKITTLIIVLISIASYAQNRMTAELLWKIKRISNIQVSPDHSKVLYTQRKYNLAKNKGSSDLFIIDLSTKEITQSPSFPSPVQNVQWRPDSKKVAFLMRDDNGRNIYEVYPDGSGLTAISKNLRAKEFKYSPNGDRIMFTQDVKLKNAHSTDLAMDLPYSNARVFDDLMYRHWSSYFDGTYTHIFFSVVSDGKLGGNGIDIMKGQHYNAPLKPFGGLEQAAFSPDGNILLYTCKKLTGKEYAVSTNSDIYAYNISDLATENYSEGMLGYDTEPAYSKDGSQIAWLSMEINGFEADKNDIVVYDVNTKSKTNLTEHIDMTVSSFVWDDKGEKIFFKSVIEATFQLFELEIKTKEFRKITSGDHNMTSIGFAGDRLIAGKQSMNHPTDIYSVGINKGDEIQLTDANKEIYDNLETGNIEKRWVKTTDGKKQLVWIIYPPNFDKNKKYPALLYCQGGPQSAVSQFFSYRWNFQLMAANDYIIIAPNRRGLPGFGQEWNDAISQDWGGLAIQDYLSAVDEIKKEPFIDEKRIGAVGASYGGYSVYYLAGVHQNRFSCFISHCGLFNFESWYGTTEELFFANFDLGGSYYENRVPNSYLEFSPHKKVKNWNTPMMIFQGEKDYRVPMGQGLEAFQALQVKDIESKLILFPEENHWVLSPQNGVFWHRQYFAWLGKYLK